jgi:short-subunit dehydrogenase
MSDALFQQKYGPWALVAGASAGLGAEFARQLAERGLHLVLLARRGDALKTLGDSLTQEFGVKVRSLAVDLGDPALWEKSEPLIADIDVGLLVYNAAYSTIGAFLEQPIDDQLRILDVNCRGPLVLSHALGGKMAARGRGGIVLMTSMAASQGGPFISAYSASKAFNLVFAEGLWAELGGHGVDVVACRAGATRTPGYDAAKPVGKVPLMDPPPVVRAALAQLGRGPSVVPGLLNRFASLVLGRLTPCRAAIRIMGDATRRIYSDRL